MSAHTARQGIFNVLTGRAVCPASRPDDEAEGLLNADRAEVISELAAKLDSRLRLTRHKTVSKDAIRRFLQLEASVARAATPGEKSSRPTADATPEAYDGELAMLRQLVRTLRVVVRPDDADMGEVRRLLWQHADDETAARQEARRG
ncbi:hypothetical protein GCM10010330_56610 [Streptomyces tendae]|uniref:hypothetical protein n=1 Tax=Streptomyces tendae TaxID=1932 RepID=UPI0016723671|nr:hypothetical protein [Streptomyces tendae]GHA95136.1 hypothetical protein GCM10010330_56610 [Streptomyces tendae]